MQALAIVRNWRAGLAYSLVLLAVLWYAGRPGDPHADKVKHVSPAETIALIDAGALVIDVREAPATTLPGAVMIPLEVLAARLASMEVAKTQPIIVYCGEGSTLGPRAAGALSQAGYTQVVNLQPGIEGWRRAGLPVNPG
jgi:rhodanese-related sulfurtransferase